MVGMSAVTASITDICVVSVLTAPSSSSKRLPIFETFWGAILEALTLTPQRERDNRQRDIDLAPKFGIESGL